MSSMEEDITTTRGHANNDNVNTTCQLNLDSLLCWPMRLPTDHTHQRLEWIYMYFGANTRTWLIPRLTTFIICFQPAIEQFAHHSSPQSCVMWQTFNICKYNIYIFIIIFLCLHDSSRHAHANSNQVTMDPVPVL